MKAIELKTGKEISVHVDHSYFDRKDGSLPIRFPQNAWVKQGEAGTWYVNQEGYIICGLGPQGYEGRFKVIFE